MTSSFLKITFADLQRSRLLFSGSRGSAYSTAHTVTCEKRVLDIVTNHDSVFLLRKNISQSRPLERNSVRNNIHPNSKQKPEITNKNT